MSDLQCRLSQLSYCLTMFATKAHSARMKTSHVRKVKPRVEDHEGIWTIDGATCINIWTEQCSHNSLLDQYCNCAVLKKFFLVFRRCIYIYTCVLWFFLLSFLSQTETINVQIEADMVIGQAVSVPYWTLIFAISFSPKN